MDFVLEQDRHACGRDDGNDEREEIRKVVALFATLERAAHTFTIIIDACSAQAGHLSNEEANTASGREKM